MKSCLLVVAVMLSGLSWAGGEVDTERVADAFAGIDITQYEGQFGFTRVLANGTTQVVNGDFTLNLDGTIPRLVIDGVQIVNWGDEPLGGLPVNKVGSATNFWLQLSGWDGWSGRYATSGWFSDVLLLPSDVITVELTLAWEEQFVAFDATGRDTSRLVLRMDGSEFSYDVNRGGFPVWFNPAVGGDYEIVDTGTGQILARGSIDEGVAEANVVNLALPAGVRELFPAYRDSAFWQNQWFSSSIERDGNWLPVQIYIARTYGNALFLEPRGTFISRIEVYSVDSDERVLVAEMDIPVPVPIGKGGEMETITQLQVPAGYDRLVVELIGSPDNWGSFSLWAYKGPGGKG